jgi:TonB family protein
MKSKLFFFKSLALFGMAMLFVVSVFAQSDAKAKNQVDPCEDPLKTAIVKSVNSEGNANANDKSNASSTNDDTPTPTVIVKSTNVDNSGKSNVQHAKITIEGNSFNTKEVEVKDSDSPRYIASPKAEYIYGRRALAEHIVKTAKYPTDAKKDKAEGIVMVQVVVEKDGSFTNPKVISSFHPKLDEEALKAVAKLDKGFTPAKEKDEVVRCYYQIPVAFLLPPR